MGKAPILAAAMNTRETAFQGEQATPLPANPWTRPARHLSIEDGCPREFNTFEVLYALSLPLAGVASRDLGTGDDAASGS